MCGMMLFRTMWAPEYRLLFWSVLQFFSVFGFSCCHSSQTRVHSLFILQMDHFRQKYTTNVQSALQSRRPAAEHASCPVFRASFAAGRWNESGGGRTLLLENRCETGVPTQQVFGGHSSSSPSRRGRAGLSSHCVFGSSPPSLCVWIQSFLLPLSPEAEARWLSWPCETRSFLPASCFCVSRFRWNVCVFFFLWHSFRELPGCHGPVEE